MAQNKKDPGEDIRELNRVMESGAFKNVHLLCGDEDYLRHQFRDKLVSALTGNDRSMNFDRFIGKDMTPEKIIDIAETMPFFADRRVILIEDSGWLKNGCEAMAEYITQGVCESTYIVFCEKETDKRNRLYKSVAASGMISEFDIQDEDTLSAWAYKMIKAAGITAAGADVRYMIDMIGTDMVNISNETEKLISYCLDKKTMTRADIDSICSRRLENRIFEMCDALALKKQKKAMEMYYDLISLREQPIKILVLVTRQFNTLLQVKDLELDRKNDYEIGQKIGRPQWTIKNYRAQTSHYRLSELKKITEQCADLDMMIKTGQMAAETGMEMLMVRLSSVD